MGQRKSKSSKTSYDVTPVEENLKIATIKIATKANELNAVKEKDEEFDPKLVPDWVNEEYFSELLQQHVDNFQQIRSFKAFPALAAGENYATLMLRVAIDIALKDNTEKSLSYMLKIPHDTAQMKQMLQAYNFFTTENAMYNEVLPELEQLYRNAGHDVSFAPKSYKFVEQPPIDYVLLEDLRPDGFKNANRLECLDLLHTERVLQKLAQYHAASACRFIASKSCPKALKIDWNNDNGRAFFAAMFDPFMQTFLSNIKNYKNCEKYYDIVAHLFENFLDLFFRNAKVIDDEFNVLTHGDCWSNNILFQYSEAGELLDLNFVDFQNSKPGAPMLDLFYFIITSTKIEIKLQHFDHFISLYYDHLIENLKLLNYPKKLPSLRDLHAQCLNYSTMTMFAATFTLPIVLLDPNENANFETLVSDNSKGSDMKTLMFTSKRYVEHIEQILPWLYNRSFLECHISSRLEAVPVCEPKKVAAEIKATSELVKIDDAVAQESTEGLASVEKSAVNEPSAYKAPEWVTQERFEDVLKQHIGDFERIVKFSVKPGTAAGDNYASTILKVDIEVELKDGTSQALSYMLKIALESEQAKTMLAFYDTFTKECTAYNEILPKLEKLLTDAGVEITLGPKSFRFAPDPGCEYVLLENLQPFGYKNAERLMGLDQTHTEFLLHKLAQYHAASAYLYANGSDCPQLYRKNLFNEQIREMMEKMSQQFLGTFLECLATYKGSEEYIHKFDIYKKNHFDLAMKLYEIDDDEFNVLNHGDCWTNNLLFQYDTAGNIKDLSFIDFQMMKFGTPAQDLYYFLLSSTNLDIKLAKFDYFIQVYHTELSKILKLLKYPKEIPSLKQLHLTLLKYGLWGPFTSMSVMPAVLLDPTDNANIETLLSEGEDGIDLKKKMYLNDRYRQHAEKIYVWLNERGLLDFDLDDSVAETVALEIPSWLDETHFNDVLKASQAGFKKILKITPEPATKSGDNFASTILRIKINAEIQDGTNKDLSFILKIPQSYAEGEDMYAVWSNLTKEVIVYNELLPAYEQLYKAANVDVTFAPKYFKFTQKTDCDTVLLEDLGARAFKMGDRLQGLDATHTKYVLHKLAQFHAASAKHVEQNGPLDKRFNEGVCSEQNRAMFEEMNKGVKELFLECARTYENSEEYFDGLDQQMDTFIDRAIASFRTDPNEFNVLNHGDCWLNNIMFQYDAAGSITEMYLIDFQDVEYGSPAFDLYYFLISSTQLDIKVDQFDYFIKYYYDHLTTHLKLLNYNGAVPTLKEFHTSLLKYAFIGYYTLLGITSMALLDPSDNAGMDMFTSNASEALLLRKQMYGSERYKAHASKVLTWLSRRGVFDI